MLKKIITDYLSFTKKERTGTLVVLFLIIIFISIPFLYPLFIHPKVESVTVFKSQMDKLVIKQADTAKKYSYKKYDKENRDNYREDNPSDDGSKKFTAQLFSFDPNTLDGAGWQRLGVKEKTIATIQKFISKGGKFYKPEDIGKIWGLHPEEIKRLMPFVEIENKKSTYPSNNSTENKSYENKSPENKSFEKAAYAPAIVDINTADTTQFIALPGIGSKLAQRIIIFREKLGGFYKIDQIGETFGLKDSVFQLLKPRFKLSSTQVNQININTATADQLKAHPYLRYLIANAIVQYRTQHGSFTAVADIKKIMLVTEDIYNKAAPYLKVN